MLYPCLSPELHEFGWGLASQGTGTVPDSEHQSLEGAVHVALPQPGCLFLLISTHFLQNFVVGSAGH